VFSAKGAAFHFEPWVAATSHSDVSLSDHSAPFLPLGPLRRRGDL